MGGSRGLGACVAVAELPMTLALTTLHLGSRLGGCELAGSTAGIAVAALVQRAPNLEKVSFALNPLQADGLLALARGLLEPLASLHDIDLTGCSLVGVEGGNAVAAVTERLPALRNLGLGCNKFGAGGMSALSAGLSQRCPYLRWLDLSGSNCDFDDAGSSLARIVTWSA